MRRRTLLKGGLPTGLPSLSAGRPERLTGRALEPVA